MKSMVSVLTTVNAPFSEQLNDADLAACLLDPKAVAMKPGHLSAFFCEVKPEDQIAFAKLHNISKQQLIKSAKAFEKFSGETCTVAL